MGRYDDIIRLPRPVSKRHPQMPSAQRAKQFMPFAALKGYGDAISEKEIRYEARSVLSEEDRALIDAALHELSDALAHGERPEVTLELFVPRSGSDDAGQLRRVTGRLQKLKPELAQLRVDGRDYDFADLVGVWREDEARE